ncbi:putative non-specific lipid-transfer protein 14 [Phtheirospermum japonicum]|uniref:Putative non-specific lipid-transfer protein 14 n=1 Tax=Phtheirospermum japonicum TaxID=374723 RepID=A0A830BCT9_9LAMI|nr:putative non-specific lipid-transfer protein 14 [Phtheirospermum japonicum]
MVRISYLTAAFIAGVTAAILLSRSSASAADDCGTVTALVSACSSFVTYGSPDPIPGSPCCVAMTSLNNLADSGDNRRAVCRCVMDLIANYSSNATAIATVPGFCGVSLGFTIDPNTDCE